MRMLYCLCKEYILQIAFEAPCVNFKPKSQAKRRLHKLSQLRTDILDWTCANCTVDMHSLGNIKTCYPLASSIPSVKPKNPQLYNNIACSFSTQ